MPDLGLIPLTGLSATGAHPFTSQDILSDEGGLLKKRGKVMYANDFHRGYEGLNPVFNATGVEHPRSPLSLINYPRRALRIAAPGPALGQGVSTDAILRLGRPRATTGLTDGAIASLSFRYGIFAEYATGAVPADLLGPVFESIGFGVDTQSWNNDERQFFTALAKFSDTDVNTETWALRGSRATSSTAIAFPDIPAARGAKGLIIGQNEGKENIDGCGRLTFRYGTTPDYIELQMGGRTVDLRGITPVNEPLQLNATNGQANFRGGFNPFFSVKLRSDIPNILAGGIFVTDICLTYGDVLA